MVYEYVCNVSIARTHAFLALWFQYIFCVPAAKFAAAPTLSSIMELQLGHELKSHA